MSMADRVPSGMGAFFDQIFGKGFDQNKGLVTVLNPWTSAIEALNRDEVIRAEGAAARDMAMLHQAEADRARAEADKAQMRAFLLSDAVGQFEAARERLAQAYSPVPNLDSRIRVAYGAESGISPVHAANFQRAKATADAILSLGATTALPSDPEMALALAARADSQRDSMAAAVAAMQDAVAGAERDVQAFDRARAEAAAARTRQALEGEKQQGQTMLQRLLGVLR